jgi:hypothetical protein
MKLSASNRYIRLKLPMNYSVQFVTPPLRRRVPRACSIFTHQGRELFGVNSGLVSELPLAEALPKQIGHLDEEGAAIAAEAGFELTREWTEAVVR